MMFSFISLYMSPMVGIVSLMLITIFRDGPDKREAVYICKFSANFPHSLFAYVLYERPEMGRVNLKNCTSKLVALI